MLLFIALFIIFLAIFILVFFLLRQIKPAVKDAKKKTFIETVKETISIQKKILAIPSINKNMNAIWVSLGKPSYPLPEDIVVMKLLIAILFILILFLLKFGAISFLIGALGFILPDFYFRSKGKQRLKEVERGLPAAIDLLTLCVEAGIDFMSAVAKVVDNSKPSPLRDEFQEIIREMQLGSDRRESLLNFSKRCDIEEVNAFVSVVVQSESLGTSLVDVLRDYAVEMRTKRWQRAEKLALEAPTKMLFPMVVFIFPGVFILIFGPVALQIMKMF